MTNAAGLFDDRACELGEGPLWHPAQQRLYWFDILSKRLLARKGDTQFSWQFDEYVSAAGWIDAEHLLIASETALLKFNTSTGTQERLCDLEADNSITRSNDGRADPKGGFWIGTMGKNAEPEQGAIYRYYNGSLHKLFDRITIPNSICFSPDGANAYFTDTAIAKIMRQPLDQEGFPLGAPEVFLDLGREGFYPDGSVIDSHGGLWNAQWGAGRVVRYAPDGTQSEVITLAGEKSTCPAFGGPNLNYLYITSAREGIAAPDNAQGKTYVIETPYSGLEEHRIRLQ